MSKIGSGFMLFKALARTPSSTIVIRWWFITRCKCRFCKRLCVNVPLAGSTTKRPTKVNTRAALAATGSSDGHEAQKPIALFWRKKINSKLFFFFDIRLIYILSGDQVWKWNYCLKQSVAESSRINVYAPLCIYFAMTWNLLHHYPRLLCCSKCDIDCRVSIKGQLIL